MRYIMKSGILSIPEGAKKLAQIKSTFGGAKKYISLYGSTTQYHANIDIMDTPSEKSGDVRYRIYTLKNECNEVLMEAHPGYAKDDDPAVLGWPICRAPKVDHADVLIANSAYLLVMHNSQNYSLRNKDGSTVLQIIHKGISGGWTIKTVETFNALVLCGLFIFCRYIEQENEFIVV